MKKFSIILNERRREYQNWLSTNESHHLNYAKSLDYYERRQYLSQFEDEKQYILERLNNPEKLETEVRQQIAFDATKYLNSIKYIIENNIDIEKQLQKLSSNWIFSDELSEEDKLIITGYTTGESVFWITNDDYDECGGLSDPNFLNNMAAKISTAYGVVIPLESNFLANNNQKNEQDHRNK